MKEYHSTAKQFWFALVNLVAQLELKSRAPGGAWCYWTLVEINQITNSIGIGKVLGKKYISDAKTLRQCMNQAQQNAGFELLRRLTISRHIALLLSPEYTIIAKSIRWEADAVDYGTVMSILRSMMITVAKKAKVSANPDERLVNQVIGEQMINNLAVVPSSKILEWRTPLKLACNFDNACNAIALDFFEKTRLQWIGLLSDFLNNGRRQFRRYYRNTNFLEAGVFADAYRLMCDLQSRPINHWTDTTSAPTANINAFGRSLEELRVVMARKQREQENVVYELIELDEPERLAAAHADLIRIRQDHKWVRTLHAQFCATS